jgi:NAD(P)-dependent dehydrogenase (short-subunit alcohol dehydrogenase family)
MEHTPPSRRRGPAAESGRLTVPSMRVFVTGSADGLGRAAAVELLDGGHEVVVHARSTARMRDLGDLLDRGATGVVADLADGDQVRELAESVNALGRMDAVIHNAGVYLEPARAATPEGHARTLAVNTLAPYLLTALISRPDRLIYLSSGMHRSGGGSLQDIDWVQRRWNAVRAYSESKLHVATLALAIARRWPEIQSHAVDPGWVPTKMGGAGAPDDLEMGHLTQTWLATSNDPSATTSGGYWYHRKRQAPAPEALDPEFQDTLLDRLAELTGIALF